MILILLQTVVQLRMLDKNLKSPSAQVDRARQTSVYKN